VAHGPLKLLNLPRISLRREAVQGAKRREDDLMRMGEIEIHDYARQMLEAYGDKAIVTAAQRACRYEEKGHSEDAQTWRHIEQVLKLMRGPHVS
jgi:hypothetical protein